MEEEEEATLDMLLQQQIVEALARRTSSGDEGERKTPPRPTPTTPRPAMQPGPWCRVSPWQFYIHRRGPADDAGEEQLPGTTSTPSVSTSTNATPAPQTTPRRPPSTTTPPASTSAATKRKRLDLENENENKNEENEKRAKAVVIESGVDDQPVPSNDVGRSTNAAREHRQGHVYFIAASPYRDECKIGHSANIIKRRQQLQTGNAARLEVLYTIAQPSAGEARMLEQALHAYLAHRQLQGEWFRLSRDEVRAAHALASHLSSEVIHTLAKLSTTITHTPTSTATEL
ncbi:uncharacterized protein ACA1_069470 [Acanthamoeba castellanii str. Neff]|uniref:Bacteriophage T5 Orf172 DNA-binding domain-containing protein n=1 Tax=Acanthamoeba castellanii (strain ATCC 30010 / Neff) TaxID=1257118 RepID=L8HF16_ACACF|nr:uncharacterized protein ACA1_069470 [Acanthamoeba castellanii str. Neff]ELR23363.1 hypothetical protein ACA1_069470 [Acanthamoeba castellanii str. Neff]